MAKRCQSSTRPEGRRVIKSRKPGCTIYIVIFRAQHEFGRNIPSQASGEVLGKASVGWTPTRVMCRGTLFRRESSRFVCKTS